MVLTQTPTTKDINNLSNLKLVFIAKNHCFVSFFNSGQGLEEQKSRFSVRKNLSEKIYTVKRTFQKFHIKLQIWL